MNPRIITGSAKGQRLSVPKKDCRPMTDRVKSALFSMINPLIINAAVLDLCAGTGALGIECLSRGAKSAVFVDRSKYAVSCIRANLEKTGFSALARIIKCSVIRFIRDFEIFNLEHDKYDIIIFTPPYKNFQQKIPVEFSQFLTTDGILIIEHPSKQLTLDRVGECQKIDTRTYGITGLSFYKLGFSKPDKKA